VYDLEVTATANPAPVSSGKDTTIRVYVTYSGLGPVPGATVTLSSDKAGNFSAITDEKNGYYMAIFRAPIVNTETLCTIRVNASKTGYGSGQGTLELTINPSGETGHVNIIISDIEGTPIGGANVTSIMQPTGILPLHGVSDEDGALTFTNILAGSYKLEIEKAGYETANLSITAVANQTKNYTINLPQIDGGLTEALLDPTTIAIIIAVITTIIVTIIATVTIRKRRRIPIPKNLKNT